MASYPVPQWEVLFLNSDGEWVTCFKAEDDAPCFLFNIEHGYSIPWEMIHG